MFVGGEKMKKIIYNILLIILLVIPFSVKADADVDSNGGANQDGGPGQTITTGIRISGNADYGLRITVVDENGNRKSERTADYWQSSFGSSIIKQMPGSTYKTKIVNQGGLSYTPLKNFVDYTYGYDTRNNNISLYDATHIGGVATSSWNSKHTTLENLVDQAVNGGSCENPKFLDDVGFNLCKYVENNECEELKKIYILIEPLVRMHDDNWVYYVFSGTEAANYFVAAHAAGEISTNTYKNNFGGSVYRNLINMYLTNQEKDSLKYRLKSNGSIYAYFISQPTSNNAGNEPSNRMSLFAGKTRDSNGNPWGSSMQIVWLGRAAKDCPEPEECCIPCDPKDQACIEAAGDNWHEKDPYCCYETGEISEDGTVEACIPAEEYWKDKQDFFEQYCTPCCKPSASNDYCCDESNEWICDGSDRKTWSEFWSENEDLYEQYCTPGEDKCERIPSLTDPEIDVVDCDDDNTNNISHFRDPVFNSENGQFKDFNSIKKIVEAAKSNNGRLPDDWLEKIATEDDDNTFAAIVYGNNAGDERYTTEVNRFCKIHCQEIFEVELPDNYPYVNAGRYFNWTIKDSKKDISKASAAKLCAMDVDLDKAIDSYLYISQSAALALQNEMAFQFNGHTGVGDVEGGNPYDSCDSFKDDYVAIASQGTGASGTIKLSSDATYVDAIDRADVGRMCPVNCGDNGCDYEFFYDYKPGNKLDFEEVAERLYSGKAVYYWIGPSGCGMGGYRIGPDYRAMGERPNGTDGTENVENILAIEAKKDFYGNSTSGVSPKKWCENTLNDYNTYVKGPGDASQVGTSGFSSMIYSLYSDMKQCNDIGEALMDNAAAYLEIDMGLELKYQTLFKEHSYSTEDGDIVSEFVEDDKYHNSACFYHEKECDIDIDGDGRNDTPFYMDPSSSLMQQGGVDKQLNCNEVVSNWGVSNSDFVLSTVENPNAYYGLEYNPDKLEMLSICNGSLDGTFNLGCNKISEDEPVYKFYDDKISYWSTAYIGFMSASNLYQLDKKINACICKDGEVLNKEEDGSCSCLREVSYKDFKEEYNNYQELPDGTLTVEFMNGSGLYPISLRYWHIGSIDENGDGHFDQFLDEYSDGKCSKDDGCMYGDPNGVCRFVIKNRIIASPDDSGICVDPPCDDDDDDIGDYGECITDGDINPDCRNVSGLNVIYRVIDLDNPFPGSDGNAREPGENWVGKEDLIKTNRDANGMGVYSLEPLYSITLTPAAIKEIRKDNHENMDGDYLKGTLVYPSNSPNISGGGYSLFIHEELESIAVNYGGDFSIKIANDDRFSDILKTR